MDLTMNTLIAGLLAAGILGTLHHQLKPLRLHAVYNYTIGSFFCLASLSWVLIAQTGRLDLVIAAWGIWGIVGFTIAGTYVLDSLAAKARQTEVERKREQDGEESTEN